jgi:hypothetical protein
MKFGSHALFAALDAVRREAAQEVEAVVETVHAYEERYRVHEDATPDVDGFYARYPHARLG